MNRYGVGQGNPLIGLGGTFTAEQILDLLSRKADSSSAQILFERVSKLEKEVDKIRKEMNR